MRDSVARSTTPRTGNVLRRAKQIAHVHSVKALEHDPSCPFVFCLCFFEGHPVTGHMRWHCSVFQERADGDGISGDGVKTQKRLVQQFNFGGSVRGRPSPW